MEEIVPAEKQLVEQYAALSTKKEELERQLAEVNKAYQDTRDKIISLLQDEDKDGTAVYSGIGRCILTKPRVFASCAEENKNSLFEFIRSKGREELVKENVHPGSLNSFVKELLDEGEQPPEFIKYYMEPGLRLLKTKKEESNGIES